MGRPGSPRYNIPAFHIHSGSVIPLLLCQAGKNRQDQMADIQENLHKGSRSGVPGNDMQRIAEAAERPAEILQRAGTYRCSRNVRIHIVYQFQATRQNHHCGAHPDSVWSHQLHCRSGCAGRDFASQPGGQHCRLCRQDIVPEPDL